MSAPATYASRFLADAIQIAGKIDPATVEEVVRIIRQTKEANGRLFFCGSGGGAGHASHAACDFRKLGGIESYSVTDNVSELTARTNDDSFETAYSEWLKVSRFGPKDCLFVFSVGGGDEERGVSRNLVSAMKLALSVNASIVGIAGRDGGMLAKVADAAVIIPTLSAADVTAQTEGFQAVVWHLIVTHPDVCATTPHWESITSS
ncbi:MAG: sugar isomerase [Acidimicrobiales bacterium]